MLHIPTPLEVVDFLVNVILVKIIIGHWVTDKVGKFLHWLLVKTQHDAIVWAHYRNRSLNKGHEEKSYMLCTDGHCSKV
jgi:hypothetical protein